MADSTAVRLFSLTFLYRAARLSKSIIVAHTTKIRSTERKYRIQTVKTTTTVTSTTTLRKIRATSLCTMIKTPTPSG